MSKNVLKAIAKAKKKERAIKRAKQKKFLTIGICALVLIAAAVVGAFLYTSQSEDEVYSAGGQSVHLSPNGKFTANLAHHVRKTGTYTKTTEDGRVTVSFIVNGNEEIGWIFNDALHIPREWDDGHGHGNVLNRVEK